MVVGAGCGGTPAETGQASAVDSMALEAGGAESQAPAAPDAMECSPDTCRTGCCQAGLCLHTSLLCGSGGVACFACTD
jgi:hypothetical protein